MKDWLFYPLMIALVAGMIAYALSLAKYEEVDGEAGLVIEGRALSPLYAAPGTSYSMAGDNVNPFAYAVLSAHVSRANAPSSAGVFLTLGPNDKKVFSNKNLRVTINARQGRANPLDSFEFRYFGKGAGNRWRPFELTREFSEYSFDFKSGNADLKVSDYVGIWPDTAGRGRTMDVKWLKVEIIDEPSEIDENLSEF